MVEAGKTPETHQMAVGDYFTFGKEYTAQEIEERLWGDIDALQAKVTHLEEALQMREANVAYWMNKSRDLEGALREAEERWSHAVEGGAESIRKANERADGFWEERRLMSREVTELQAKLREAEAKVALAVRAGVLLDNDARLTHLETFPHLHRSEQEQAYLDWLKEWRALQQPKAGA